MDFEAKERKDIPSVSIDKLVTVFHKKDNDAYTPGCLISTRSSDSVKDYADNMNHPFRLDAILVILCETGGFTITSNTVTETVSAGDLFVNFPGQIISCHTDATKGVCKVHVIALNKDFIQSLNLDFKPIIQKMLDLKYNQRFGLKETTFSEMRNVISTIADEINNNSRDDLSSEIMRSLIGAFLFKLCRIISQNTEATVNKEDFDKNLRYFKEFMRLLSEHYKSERSVKFYADLLHLSPKYFTTIIKRASGNTVAQWINHFVILEAKNLLKYSTMNIQEIAYSLNFPNQSFFGKYFKQHTGMTPSEYKRS